MGDKKWQSGTSERTTRQITRRSILASVGAGATVGLAGCTGDDGGGDGDSIIPGEVVYHELSGVEVLDHWAEQDGGNDWLKLEIQNNRGDQLKKPVNINFPDGSVPIIRGRTLTGQGNNLLASYWTGRSTLGPGSVNPDTSAVIGINSEAAAENAARYELCLYSKEQSGSMSWGEGCTE